MTKQEECVYFGVITVIISSTLMCCQMIYLKKLHKKPWSFGAEFAIFLLFLISIFDIFQLVAHFSAGIQMLIWPPYFPGLKYFGGLLTLAWNNVIFTLCFLSFHRTVWVVFPTRARILMPPFIPKAFLLLLFLYSLFHIYIILFSTIRVIFMPSYMMWNVVGSDLLWTKQIFLSLNRITNYLIVYFNLPFYAVIIVALVSRPRISRTTADNFVLVQMFVFWGFGAFTWVVWEFFPEASTYWLQFCNSVLLWEVWNGMKPLAALSQFGIRKLVEKRHLVKRVSVSNHSQELFMIPNIQRGKRGSTTVGLVGYGGTRKSV